MQIPLQISSEHADLSESVRGAIEREVKRLYGVRSSVVHSGKDAVDPKDLNAFLRICRNVILRLLSEEDFKQMESASRLAEYFRQRKYAASVKR